MWDSWQQAAARGRVAHCCDDPFAYGLMVKAGLGIGLLGSYAVMEPAAVPLEIGVRVSVPLFLLALTERLQARPVRLVFDWLADIFGSQPMVQRRLQARQPAEQIRRRLPADVQS